MKASARAWLPIALLVGGYLLLVLFTFSDYGITYDEVLHSQHGDRILRWYTSGFRDRAVLAAGNLEYYGGFFDVLGQAAAHVSPFGLYETRHLVNALFSGLGVFATGRLGLRLGGARAGFLAALFLLVTPVWYGHGFANPKDIPFAVLYLLSLDAIVAAVPRLPNIPWRHCLWLGLTIGLTLAVRFGGVLLFVSLGAAFVAWLVGRWQGTRDLRLAALAAVTFAGRAAVIAAIAWLTMLPWWPAAQVSPIRHPVRTLRELSVFQWNYPVFFGGQQIRAMELPWTYLPTWLMMKLPEFLLIGVVMAALFAVASRRRRRSGPLDLRSPTSVPLSRSVLAIQWGTLWFAALFPLAYAISRDSVVYDGMRHFLFVVPVFAITAAAGFDRALELPRRAGLIAAAILSTTTVWTIVDMIRIHPFQYIWVNRAVAGGLREASRSYETDYWGAAFKEATQWVSRTYATPSAQRSLRVATCFEPTATAYYLPADRFAVVEKHQNPDLFLGSSRWGCVDTVDGRVVHTVERQGVTLVTIKETGQLTAARAR